MNLTTSSMTRGASELSIEKIRLYVEMEETQKEIRSTANPSLHRLYSQSTPYEQAFIIQALKGTRPYHLSKSLGLNEQALSFVLTLVQMRLKHLHTKGKEQRFIRTILPAINCLKEDTSLHHHFQSLLTNEEKCFIELMTENIHHKDLKTLLELTDETYDAIIDHIEEKLASITPFELQVCLNECTAKLLSLTYEHYEELLEITSDLEEKTIKLLLEGQNDLEITQHLHLEEGELNFILFILQLKMRSTLPHESNCRTGDALAIIKERILTMSDANLNRLLTLTTPHEDTLFYLSILDLPKHELCAVLNITLSELEMMATDLLALIDLVTIDEKESVDATSLSPIIQ